MTDDLARLRAALAARMQQIGVALDDPRIAPLMAQMQASLQQRVAAARNVATLAAPTEAARDDASGRAAAAALAALPARLQELVQRYVQAVHADRNPAVGSLRVRAFFTKAPALADSDAGRALLQLPGADKASVAVATYAAWASERHGGADGGLLRRIVSDLLRAKLELSDTQAVELARAAAREGFSYASCSPNLAVASALKRHVETHGLSLVLREALTGLRTRMVHTAAAQNSEGRKLLVIVDAMFSHTGDAADSEPRFTPKNDAWGRALAAKLAGLVPELRARMTRVLALAAQGGGNAKPAKGWLKAAEQELAAGEPEREGVLLLEIIECHEPGAALAPENQNTLRALIWLAAMATPAAGSAPARGLRAKMPDVLLRAFRLSVARARQCRGLCVQPHAGHDRRRESVTAQAPPEAAGRDQGGREGAGGARGSAWYGSGGTRGDRPAGL